MTNRRQFLSIATAAIAAAVCKASTASPFQTGTMSPGPGARTAKRWGMVIDMKRCDGDCQQECIAACREVHNVPYIPKAEHEIMWLFEKPYENAFPERAHATISKRMKERKFLLLCNHCDDPPCVRACPTRATFKRKTDGIVMMDYHRCIGCRFCMAACPYGSRSFNFRNPRPFIKKINPGYPTRRRGVVEKCNFCQEILVEGGMPACVEACKSKALVFGDLDDPDSEISRLLEEKPHMRRKPSLGTRPSVFYIV